MTDESGPLERVVIGPEGLRDLAHPVRWKIWESLLYDGPGTSTTLAARLGESSGSTSYHLRRMQAMGLIQDQVERGNGRDRWWKAVPGGFRVAFDQDDAGAAVAADAVAAQSARSNVERYLEFRRWAGSEFGQDREWVQASTNEQGVLHLTVSELDEFTQELEALLARWYDRSQGEHEDARPVEILLRAFPRVER